MEQDTGTRILLPRVMEISDDGVRLSDDAGSTQWKWSAFDGWAETANLLLLRESGSNSYVIIPKRAVAGAAELDLLRSVVRARAAPTR